MKIIINVLKALWAVFSCCTALAIWLLLGIIPLALYLSDVGELREIWSLVSFSFSLLISVGLLWSFYSSFFDALTASPETVQDNIKSRDRINLKKIFIFIAIFLFFISLFYFSVEVGILSIVNS